MKTPTITPFIVILFALLLLNACTPRRDVLRDDGGEYTVSASSELTAGIQTQLRAPRIVLEIRNYDSKTWGQRSRAALKITWYDETPIIGTADVALVERATLDTLVLTSQQAIDIALPAGRRSRTVTYYSSYFYSPDAAMCAEAALTLDATDGSNFIRIVQDQRACEESDQATPQDQLITNQRFDLGNGDVLDMELFKNDANEYRGKLRLTATQGGWTPSKDGNRMGIRSADSSRYKRSNGFTAGFDHPGTLEFVTRYAPDLTDPVCFDVTMQVRNQEVFRTLCTDGEPESPPTDTPQDPPTEPDPEPDPQPAPEPAPPTDDYTLIWNMPYVLQNGQGAFDFEIHQHNTEPNTFRAQLTTAFFMFEIDSLAFTITGYADAPTSASIPFTPNSTITTDWIASNAPGEEVCFLLEGTYNAIDAVTLARHSDTFRYSACMENRLITNPPTPSSWAGAVARIPNTQGVVTVWLMADGDAIDSEVLISPMPVSRDQMGIFDGNTVAGTYYDSGITLGQSSLDIPANNGGRFQLLDDGQPCLELTLVYGEWDGWENYFEPQLFEMTVCLPG